MTTLKTVLPRSNPNPTHQPQRLHLSYIYCFLVEKIKYPDKHLNCQLTLYIHETFLELIPSRHLWTLTQVKTSPSNPSSEFFIFSLFAYNMSFNCDERLTSWSLCQFCESFLGKETVQLDLDMYYWISWLLLLPHVSLYTKQIKQLPSVSPCKHGWDVQCHPLILAPVLLFVAFYLSWHRLNAIWGRKGNKKLLDELYFYKYT